MKAPTAKAADDSGRVTALRSQGDNLTGAIAEGVLKASPAIAAELAAAEDELQRLLSADVGTTVSAAEVSQLRAALPAQARKAVISIPRSRGSSHTPAAPAHARHVRPASGR
jgi:hypothetical protein